jgi:membrane-associated PAP2 superfamily phosphatase
MWIRRPLEPPDESDFQSKMEPRRTAVAGATAPLRLVKLRKLRDTRRHRLQIPWRLDAYSVARTLFIILVALGVLTGVIFAADSSLDLQVASFFRDLSAHPEARRFDRVIDTVRQVGPFVIIGAVGPALVTLALKMFLPQRHAPTSTRAALFVVLTLALGPGLLVNGILKETWARPRPGSVIEFGGEHRFMPWWDPRGTCDSNCSFVSGETSSAVWITAPAMMTPLPWRYAALGAAALYGAGFAFIRLLAGGHFLSDVLFAAIFTGLVIWAVHGFLFRWPATRMNESALNGRLEKLGRGAARMLAAWTPSRGPRPDKTTPPA